MLAHLPVAHPPPNFVKIQLPAILLRWLALGFTHVPLHAPRMLRTGNTEHRLSSQHQEGRHTQEPDSTTLAVEEVQVSTACARNLSQHQVGRHTQEPDSTTLAVEEVQVSTALPLLAVMERLHW